MNIPLFKIYWHEDDIQAVEKIIRSGKYWCTGSEIEEFEERINKYLGSKFCAVFNSGGSALHSLMYAHGIGKGDEVIIPSFTFIATAFAPMYTGATPIFADIEEATFGLDPDDVRERIGPKTKAIMPIHYGGVPCQIGALKDLAEEMNVLLVEDAAESFGAKYQGKNVGTFGDSGMFSFCHNKVFTTSEGGCIVTDDAELYERVKLFRSYGRVLSGDYFGEVKDLDYIEVGYNFRMSTILAALGMSQLGRVDESIRLRRRNAQYLNESLVDIEEIIVPQYDSKDNYEVYQMYTIRVKQGKAKRDALNGHLTKKGISAKVYFDPVHEYGVFANREKIALPTTQMLSDQVLTLPMYPHMTDDELVYIVGAIKEFF